MQQGADSAVTEQPLEQGALFSGTVLCVLPRPIREARRPALALAISWMLTFGGAMLIATLLSYVVPASKQPDFSPYLGKGMFTVIIVAVITPLLETLIMAAFCALLLRFVRPTWAIFISALAWGLMHSSQAPIWGLVIFWPFLIFSTLFVVWKQRSLAWGIMMPFLAHFLHNLLPTIAMAYPGTLPALA